MGNIVYAPDHPLAASSGQIYKQRYDLYERIGPGKHPCHWCGRLLEWRTGEDARKAGAITVARLDPARGSEPSNLVPSCLSCNQRQSHPDAITDEEPYVYDVSGKRRRAEERACEWCGETFLLPKTLGKPGRGRFCSRSCRMKAWHAAQGHQVSPPTRR
jgi:hypothetical protein